MKKIIIDKSELFKQTLSLMFSCPLNTINEACVFSNFRHFDEIDIYKTIKIMGDEEILLLKRKHEECFKNAIKHININGQCKTKYLKWVHKKNIGVLTYELKKNGLIKSQNEFAKLFSEKIDDNDKVRWNYFKRYELAMLFYKLKESEYFIPIGSKGYYNYIENHVIGFNNEVFAKNQLKKLCYKMKINDFKDYRCSCYIKSILETL